MTSPAIVHITKDSYRDGGTYRLTVTFPDMEPIVAADSTDLYAFGSRVAGFFEEMEGYPLEVTNDMPAECECGNTWSLCHPFAGSTDPKPLPWPGGGFVVSSWPV